MHHKSVACWHLCRRDQPQWKQDRQQRRQPNQSHAPLAQQNLFCSEPCERQKLPCRLLVLRREEIITEQRRNQADHKQYQKKGLRDAQAQIDNPKKGGQVHQQQHHADGVVDHAQARETVARAPDQVIPDQGVLVPHRATSTGMLTQRVLRALLWAASRRLGASTGSAVSAVR